MIRLGLALYLLLALVGCTRSISMTVLEPALVTSPPDIRTLAVVDRSRPRNVGEHVLGTVEGLLTGEAIGADHEGRRQAIHALSFALQDSPRFDTVRPYTPSREMETSLFDRELSWAVATRICREAGCQGIVSLETFNSNSSVDVHSRNETIKNRDGTESLRVVFDAERRTEVRSAWRYYDVLNRRVLDYATKIEGVHTFSESANTRERAIRQLPPQGEGVGLAGAIAGERFAARISPTYVRVSRSYYSRGNTELKLARNHVRARDWDGAVDRWQSVYERSPKTRLRGRAALNLAVANEVFGDLDGAVEWATEAAILLGNSRARTYRRVIEGRRARNQLVQEQMRQEEPGQVGPDRTRAPSPRQPRAPAPPADAPPPRSSPGSGRTGSRTPR